MSLNPAQFKKIAIIAARQADQKKAEEISLLDLKKTDSSLADYVLVMSANSEVHLKTLQETIEETLDQMQMHPNHKDGARGAHWMVLDYGGLMVHILHENVRKFYALERLWENAREVHWQEVRSKRQRGKK